MSRTNQYTFVWRKAVARREAKMQQQISERMEEINIGQILSLQFHPETAVGDLRTEADCLAQRMQMLGLEPVHGCGHKKSQMEARAGSLSVFCINGSIAPDTKSKMISCQERYSHLCRIMPVFLRPLLSIHIP